MSETLEQMSERIWLRHTQPDRFKIELIKQFALGPRLLDVGCAQGWYGRAAAEMGHEVTWSDLTCDVLPDLEDRFVEASVTNLPFADGSFETTLALDVVEHVPDDAKAFKELARVTTRRLILSVPNGDDAVLHQYNLTYKHHIDKTHQREYLIDELIASLTLVGFAHCRVRRSGMVRPEIVSEFVRSARLRPWVRRVLRLLVRARILTSRNLQADIVVIADKPAGPR